ncbi:TM2 domain-containing membrane protein YozV [Microbacterium sp. AK009]|uniref:DUF2510 domain-containing protein n=1 Tax=Microbacterium sp. AK009 TaxID=2723068 RepID=UPI0015C807D8|nr:DUF2510 domain-containing protein [Microbacterium sp. AK009]NYF15674.1 TM2 domain-containing membrane protein YozV [Microbacterium sp. AK009]
MNPPPTPPAGWYDVPAGGKRFWDGKSWSADVVGAPSATAEYEALDPYLPPPRATTTVATVPMTPLVESAAAGWYPGPTGALRWWDGRQWGPFAPSVVAPAKEVGIAYLFLLLLGGVAAQRFYLGLIPSAIVFNILWWGGWLLSILLIGIPMILAAAIWWVVDLFLLPTLVRRANAVRVMGQ